MRFMCTIFALASVGFTTAGAYKVYRCDSDSPRRSAQVFAQADELCQFVAENRAAVPSVDTRSVEASAESSAAADIDASAAVRPCKSLLAVINDSQSAPPTVQIRQDGGACGWVCVDDAALKRHAAALDSRSRLLKPAPAAAPVRLRSSSARSVVASTTAGRNVRPERVGVYPTSRNVPFRKSVVQKPDWLRMWSAFRTGQMKTVRLGDGPGQSIADPSNRAVTIGRRAIGAPR